jgi:hypothetical protein
MARLQQRSVIVVDDDDGEHPTITSDGVLNKAPLYKRKQEYLKSILLGLSIIFDLYMASCDSFSPLHGGKSFSAVGDSFLTSSFWEKKRHPVTIAG